MNIWFPEGLYLSSLAYSSLLLTSALFFYHMVRVRSIDMNPLAAGIFAIALIVISVTFVGLGISIYYTRIMEMAHFRNLSEDQRMIVMQEKRQWILYFVLGVLYMLVQIGIGFYIITQTLRQFGSAKKSLKRRGRVH